MANKHSFEGSLIKQNRRNDILGSFRARHTDHRVAVNIFTLPGEFGLSDPESLENQILQEYPHSRLVCVEQQPQLCQGIIREAEESPRDIVVYHTDTESFFSYPRDRFPDKTVRSFDLIFLDWMNGLNRGNWETLDKIFKYRWLRPGGVLALTINAGPRCRNITDQTLQVATRGVQHQALVLQEELLKLGRSHGFKHSEKSYAIPYSCIDESIMAEPMILAVFVGIGKESHNAYIEEA